MTCRSYTARSAAYQVKVCLLCQEGLDRQGGQAKVVLITVIQGFSQQKGIDDDETFAPVAKVTTFRLMLALSKVLNLEIHQLDVDSAFLYADLEEDV